MRTNGGILRLPPNIQTIGDKAFTINQFRDIKIPESVTFIHQGAFGSLVNCTSLVLPKGFTGPMPNFTDCNKLRDLRVSYESFQKRTVAPPILMQYVHFYDVPYVQVRIGNNTSNTYGPIEGLPLLTKIFVPTSSEMLSNVDIRKGIQYIIDSGHIPITDTDPDLGETLKILDTVTDTVTGIIDDINAQPPVVDDPDDADRRAKEIEEQQKILADLYAVTLLGLIGSGGGDPYIRCVRTGTTVKLPNCNDVYRMYQNPQTGSVINCQVGPMKCVWEGKGKEEKDHQVEFATTVKDG
jgi:hypothetical protein